MSSCRSQKDARKRPRKPAPTPIPIEFHYLIESGWLHTHGMEALGLPELEARHIPGFLCEANTTLLSFICDYMIESDARVRAGETMKISDRTHFRFVASEPMPGNEDHYVVERLQIVDFKMMCECCRLRLSEEN
jgi:hypothetical protein